LNRQERGLDPPAIDDPKRRKSFSQCEMQPSWMPAIAAS